MDNMDKIRHNLLEIYNKSNTSQNPLSWFEEIYNQADSNREWIPWDRKEPHPFVVETVQMLNKEKDDEKSKIKFIHLNHTNPLLDSNSNAHKKVIANGFNIGKFKEIIPL